MPAVKPASRPQGDEHEEIADELDDDRTMIGDISPELLQASLPDAPGDASPQGILVDLGDPADSTEVVTVDELDLDTSEAVVETATGRPRRESDAPVSDDGLLTSAPSFDVAPAVAAAAVVQGGAPAATSPVPAPTVDIDADVDADVDDEAPTMLGKAFDPAQVKALLAARAGAGASGAPRAPEVAVASAVEAVAPVAAGEAAARGASDDSAELADEVEVADVVSDEPLPPVSEPPTSAGKGRAVGEPVAAPPGPVRAPVVPHLPPRTSGGPSASPLPPAEVPTLAIADERDAFSFLADAALLDEWVERAGWLEGEARAIEDRVGRARALLNVSEMLAMAGEGDRSQAVADEALALAPELPLAHRQARGRLVRDSAIDTLVGPLEAESAKATSPAARAHSLLFASEIARLSMHDGEQADRLLARALEADPADARAHALRVARELGASGAPTRHRVPAHEGLAPLAVALDDLDAHRGAPPSNTAGSPVRCLAHARLALSEGRSATVVDALTSFFDLEGLAEPALWLASVLSASSADGRARAVDGLSRLVGTGHPDQARALLAARLFEQHRPAEAREALDALGARGGVGAPEFAAALALMGAAPVEIDAAVGAFAAHEEMAPLAASLSSARGSARTPTESGNEVARTHIALGRALAAGEPQLVEEATTRLVQLEPDGALGQALTLERAATSGDRAGVGAALSHWPASGDDATTREHHRALAASLAFELGGDAEAAAREAAAARQVAPNDEAALRVEVSLRPHEAPVLLEQFGASVADASRRCLLQLEAAVRLGSSTDEAQAQLRAAHEGNGDVGLAAAIGARAAALAGDRDAVRGWVALSRDASGDPVAQALEGVREANLVAASDPSHAVSLLEQACAVRPDDVALRDALDLVSPEPRADRAATLAARAERTSGPVRAERLLVAALEFARASDLAQAARLAELAVQAGGGELANVLRDRLDERGPGASRLAEALMAVARSAETPAAEREAYERLARLDEAGRGDAASALLWHRAILEKDPAALASLRRLEHALVTEGRIDELEPIFVEIARALSGAESAAHAMVAARLRQRSAPWSSTRELAQIAARGPSIGVWALRQTEAHGHANDDPDAIVQSAIELAGRTDRPAELATLRLRAAEALTRKGEQSAAVELVRQVLEARPDHPVARLSLPDMLARSGDQQGAADALESAARLDPVAAHKARLWSAAATMWLDVVGDVVRGTAALESTVDVDMMFPGAFERLSELYERNKEHSGLARLLDRRLDHEQDPSKRAALQIALGQALVAAGDLAAARATLATALEAQPEHVDALRAFADLCAGEGDWASVEDTLRRLAALLSAPSEQARTLARLGAVYDEHLADPARAERAFLDALERLPGDTETRERLVKLYAATGQRDRAFEVQRELLAAAAAPADKRQRTIELAGLFEGVAGDAKKAEQTLDALRKEMPQDTVVLRALAGFHQRHNNTTPLNTLLDRTATEARRAITTGRFELHFFSNLAAVFEVRGLDDAAQTALGTVEALEARPCPVRGVSTRAARVDLDDLLAPDIFSPSFRELLRRVGSIIDAATAVDLKAIRATMPSPAHERVVARATELAAEFGLDELQVLVSPAIGPVCMPLSSSPPTVVFGLALVADEHEAIREFLTLRALKIIQARVAAFSRTPPIDVWPLVAALLQSLAPSWSPQAADPAKLRDYKARLQKHLPTPIDPELARFALEVGGVIGNRASTLQSQTNAWGSRCALLATGDATTALDAIAFASGQTSGAPTPLADRMRWTGRNAEARDVMVFSVSEAYSEARKRA